jgi:hypothetical protein
MLWACAIATAAPTAGVGQDRHGGITQEVGLTLSDYKYSESAMALTARKLGVGYSVTFPFRGSWFIQGVLRGAIGDADYRGTGAMNGVPDWYFENRWGVGRSFILGRHTLTPDIGLGYRYLYNDLRGTTDTGAVGYRRESRYVTARAGFRYSFSLPNRDTIEASVEHDRLILGRQDTRLSDIEGRGPWISVPDVTNYQHRGEGWRFGSTYRRGDWSVGSYLHLWHIKDSDKEHIRVVKTTGAENWTVWEPTNNTREFGVRVSYRF